MPARSPGPPPASSIVPARGEHIPGLLAIEQRCFSGDRLSPRALSHLLERGNADCLVALLDREPAGYGLVLYRRNARVARLHSLAVDPARRGRGLGSALLQAAESAARDRGCSTLRLAVRQDNAAAIRLYSGAGYAERGRQGDYYCDGAAALVLEKRLSKKS